MQALVLLEYPGPMFHRTARVAQRFLELLGDHPD